MLGRRDGYRGLVIPEEEEEDSWIASSSGYSFSLSYRMKAMWEASSSTLPSSKSM